MSRNSRCIHLRKEYFYMKIVAVLGSPRAKSNSSALARKVLQVAGEKGAETSEFILNKLEFKGCQACEVCKKKLDQCVLKDDLKPVLEAVKEADAVVLASPNYFSEVSSQFKAFFDRTYSFLNADFSSRLQPGKSSVFIFSQGQPDLNLYQDVFPRYEMWLKRYGFAQNHLLRMNGPREPDSVSKREDLLDEAARLAETLVSTAK